MFKNPRRGRQARNSTTNVQKILDRQSSSEQIFSETFCWVPLIVAHLCLNSPMRQTNWNDSTWLSDHISVPKQIQQQTDQLLFVPNAPRKRFTTIPVSGGTKSTLIFQEGRLGWTLTRLSYRLIGTHRLTRSVLEWRSISSSSLLSSTIKPDPCIHWSQITYTEILHWAVTRGRSSLGLRPLCKPTVTRKDSTFYVTAAATPKRELVSLLTMKMTVKAATPESGLALEGIMMTPTRVAMKLLMMQIMATSTSKPWDTSWSNNRGNSLRNCLQTAVKKAEVALKDN